MATPLKNLRKKRKEDEQKLKELNKAVKEAEAQHEKLQNEMKALNEQKEVPSLFSPSLRQRNLLLQEDF